MEVGGSVLGVPFKRIITIRVYMRAPDLWKLCCGNCHLYPSSDSICLFIPLCLEGVSETTDRDARTVPTPEY